MKYRHFQTKAKQFITSRPTQQDMLMLSGQREMAPDGNMNLHEEMKNSRNVKYFFLKVL